MFKNNETPFLIERGGGFVVSKRLRRGKHWYTWELTAISKNNTILLKNDGIFHFWYLLYFLDSWCSNKLKRAPATAILFSGSRALVSSPLHHSPHLTIQNDFLLIYHIWYLWNSSLVLSWGFVNTKVNRRLPEFGALPARNHGGAWPLSSAPAQ